MARVYNFSAGPAVLPEEVLQEVADEMLDYNGTGMSVMEMSHRSKAYQEIIDTAEADLRELMNIPDNYKVLFLQGGAHLQFAMVPMNLMKNKVADYIVTGQWAKKAAKELISGETTIGEVTKQAVGDAVSKALQDVGISAETAKWYRDVYRRYRDYSIVATAAVYLLQVIDANVFAYMHDFEVTDDLTMNVSPTVILPYNEYAMNTPVMNGSGSSAVGMRIGFTF